MEARIVERESFIYYPPDTEGQESSVFLYLPIAEKSQDDGFHGGIGLKAEK